MKWLLALSLCALANSEVIRIGLQSRRAPNQWRKYGRMNQNALEGRNANKAQGLYNDKTSYLGNFTIGTPPQQFVLALVTYTTGLWVYDSTYRKSGFDSSLSETYVKDGRVYTDEGFLGNDTMTLGGADEVQITLEKEIFAQFDHPHTFYGDDVDGEFGLGFSPMNGLASPIASAFNRGLIDKPIFSLWLETSVHKAGGSGELTYGGVDSERCSDIVTYEPILPRKTEWDSDWRFNVTSIGVGDYTSSVELEATISTFSFIGGPTKIIDGLASSLGLKLNETYHIYFVDCLAQLPPISITIGGNKYEIESKNYIVPGERFAEGSNICQFGFDGDGDQQGWTLGLPFMRQFCTVYDFKEEKIGFAAQKRNDTSDPIVEPTNGLDTTTNSNLSHNAEATSFLCATAFALFVSSLFG